ncbi:ATP-binding protein [Ferruginibacter paludis]|uniref:HAMP domain-containing sensor histidine kinase n=1 Tax=Ferruginibacter paludis TaxID=1310417 RepID=UPI0025B48686|nr:ATP-binding protein [Ferruginibacter paludis]MDN3656684.1 ATP-binding protein [Ferruginibacter paludis]
MSIKYKIAFLFSGLVTIILAIVSLAVFFFSARERDNAFKKRLKNRALSTAKVYSDINDNNYGVLRRLDAAAVASLYNKSVTIAGFGDGKEYMFSDTAGDSLYLSPDIIEQATSADEYFFTYQKKKAVALHYTGGDKKFIIAVAASDIDGQEYLQQLKKILLIAAVMAVMLSFYAGVVFAKNLINPIKRITGEVNLITSNNFSQRIKINKAKDELTKLALTFNSLLDRLQDSFAIQRRFISNASHELSTPLTSVSAQLEVALQKPRTQGEYQAVLESVYEDIKALHLLTRSLLDIAKTGSQGSIDLNEVRLDEVLMKVISDVQKQTEGYKVALNFETLPDDEQLFTVFGNSNLLYIAFKNIIENGCKYSDNKESAISVLFDKKAIVINVTNSGDIIAEADIQNIFQPFFRAENVQQKPGFGLGLTLTKRILFLHKGSIAVESNLEKGTIFTIELPNILAKI